MTLVESVFGAFRSLAVQVIYTSALRAKSRHRAKKLKIGAAS